MDNLYLDLSTTKRLMPHHVRQIDELNRGHYRAEITHKKGQRTLYSLREDYIHDMLTQMAGQACDVQLTKISDR